jgi:hypothetical protein
MADAATVDLREVYDNALTAMYAYQRDHFRQPERFRLSREARDVVRAELKRQLVRWAHSSGDETARQAAIDALADHSDGPLTLCGITVEVGDALTGAEVEVK